MAFSTESREAMDWLQSHQDTLCACLSDVPDYILKQCGDILTMNEFKEVQKQKSPAEKITMLSKVVINKGEDVCQAFVDILKEHQVHYQQLQQLFNPATKGSAARAVFADHSSVVTAKEITNTKVNSMSVRIETECHPGRNVYREVPPAMHTACDGSVICVDKLTGVTIGDINLSVCTKTSNQTPAGPVDEKNPFPRGPAAAMLLRHKVELIECLSGDLFILQYVHARSIITDRQYQNLKCMPLNEATVTNLLDMVIKKGQETCAKFLDVLKEPEIIRTYPRLEGMMKA